MAATRIFRLIDLTDTAARTTEIDAIFFAASNTQAFADDGTRVRFRERWLGRYLTHDAALTRVALDPAGHVTGYVVGSTDDPALTPRFADIGYLAALADLTARYPAHLHVNLTAPARGVGIGSALVEAFCRDAADAGVPGVHVVTGQGARNAVFYHRLGFAERRVFTANGADLVFLGRDL